MEYQDWREQKDQWREEKRRLREERRAQWYGRRGGRGWMGVVLIAIGALFLLSNLGFYYIDDIWQYWPVILIAVGASNVARSRHPSGWLSGGFLMIMGAAFLLHNLGYLRASAWQFFWPLILIMIGASMLLRGRWGTRGSVVEVGGLASSSTGASPNTVDEWAVFGGVKRRIDSQEFEGGEAFAMFGGVELDLRKAGTKKDEIRIEANAMFGGVEIRVPETWEVATRGAGIFGGYDDKTQTIPSGDGKRPILIVTGHAVFGGVAIKN